MSRDYLVRVSRVFVGGVPSFQVTTLQSLGSIGLVKWNYIVFYLSRKHDIEVSRDFVGGVLSV